jgi:hypothetical protein
MIVKEAVPFVVNFSRRTGESSDHIQAFLSPVIEIEESFGSAYLVHNEKSKSWRLFGWAYNTEFFVELGRFFGIASRAYEFLETSHIEITLTVQKELQNIIRSYPMPKKLIPINDTIVGAPIFEGMSELAKRTAVDEYRKGMPIKARVIAVGPHAKHLKPGDVVLFPVAQGTLIETARGLFLQHPENKIMVYEEKK